MCGWVLENDLPIHNSVPCQIDVGLGRALCARITYVGELGYELFVPVEYDTKNRSPIVPKLS